MREEARAKRQRDEHHALYERFAAGASLPLAQPSAPELTGLGYYHATDPQDPDATQAAAATAQPGTDPHTQLLSTLNPSLDASLESAVDSSAQHPVDSPVEPPFEDSQDDQQQDQQSHYAAAPELAHEPEHEDYAPFAVDPQQAAAKKQRRARARRKRNIVLVSAVLIFALVIVGSVFTVKSVLKQFNPDDYPGPGGESVTLTVEDGWGVNVISRKLEELDVVSDDKLFAAAVAASDATNKTIHPGTYLLKKQMSAAQAVDGLIDNKQDKVFYFALNANTRLKASLEAIADGSGLKLDELSALANDPAAFGLPAEVANLEGWLHPGEYRFALDTDASTVLQTLVDATVKTLNDAGQKDLGQGYRALKIASILQAEATAKDYATVAGAIENRLRSDNTETRGLLQVDSAVIYGLDRYTLQFTPEEKADASNPYNTYVHAGLPPTPIGSPNDAAIKAAVNPESNNYYYWVTVNTQSGETKFASTYAEHQRNQGEFRTWCAANADVCK